MHNCTELNTCAGSMWLTPSGGRSESRLAIPVRAEEQDWDSPLPRHSSKHTVAKYEIRTLPQVGRFTSCFPVFDALREVVILGLLRFVGYSGSLPIAKHQKQRSDPSICRHFTTLRRGMKISRVGSMPLYMYISSLLHGYQEWNRYELGQQRSADRNRNPES